MSSRICADLVVVCILSTVVSAQVQIGAVRGRVLDASGNPVSTAKVAAVYVSTLDATTPEVRVFPDVFADCDSEGKYTLYVPTVAGTQRFVVYSVNSDHYDEIYGANPVEGISGVPRMSSFFQGSVLHPDIKLFKFSKLYQGIDFALPSSKITLDIDVGTGATPLLLATDIYYPAGQGGVPTLSADAPFLLFRTAYGRATSGFIVGKSLELPGFPMISRLNVPLAYYTLFGYTVVAQDLRGLGGPGGSEGISRMFRENGFADADDDGIPDSDGYETLEYLRTTYGDGIRVGAYGASADAANHYLTSGRNHPNLQAAYMMISLGDLYRLWFVGGIYRMDLLSYLTSIGNPDPQLPALVLDMNRLPGGDYWDEARLGFDSLQPVNFPYFHVTGWFDLFVGDQIAHFTDLAAANPDQTLMIGPWSHDLSTASVSSLDPEAGGFVWPYSDGGPSVRPGYHALDYFDYYLMDEGDFGTRDRVTYFTLGNANGAGALGNEWRTTDTWPPTDLGVVPKRLYMLGQSLSLLPGPSVNALYYDQACTVHTWGGANLFPGSAVGCGPGLNNVCTVAGTPPTGCVAGPPELESCEVGIYELIGIGATDQSCLEKRSELEYRDVLTYTSCVLDQPVEITGEVRVHLRAIADTDETDWIVKLTDVYPASECLPPGSEECSYWIGETALKRDVPSPMVQEFDLTLNTSIVFDAGHRIRISVATSNCPRLEPQILATCPTGVEDRVRLRAVLGATETTEGSYVELPIANGTLLVCE